MEFISKEEAVSSNSTCDQETPILREFLKFSLFLWFSLYNNIWSLSVLWLHRDFSLNFIKIKLRSLLHDVEVVDFTRLDKVSNLFFSVLTNSTQINLRLLNLGSMWGNYWLIDCAINFDLNLLKEVIDIVVLSTDFQTLSNHHHDT